MQPRSPCSSSAYSFLRIETQSLLRTAHACNSQAVAWSAGTLLWAHWCWQAPHTACGSNICSTTRTAVRFASTQIARIAVQTSVCRSICSGRMAGKLACRLAGMAARSPTNEEKLSLQPCLQLDSGRRHRKRDGTRNSDVAVPWRRCLSSALRGAAPTRSPRRQCPS